MSAKPSDKDLMKALTTSTIVKTSLWRQDALASMTASTSSSVNSQSLDARLAEAEANKKALEQSAQPPKAKKAVQFTASTDARENAKIASDNETTKKNMLVQQICAKAKPKLSLRSRAGSDINQVLESFTPLVQKYVEDPMNFKILGGTFYGILNECINEMNLNAKASADDETTKKSMLVQQICAKAKPKLSLRSRAGSDINQVLESFIPLVQKYVEDPMNFKILGGTFYGILNECINEMNLPKASTASQKATK